MVKEKNDKPPVSVAVMRHSAAHVLAQAVLQLYPEAKLAIGPAIEDGFYYDFDLGAGKTFSPADLLKLEKTMKKNVAQSQKFERYEASIDESIEYLKEKQQPYKLELAEELKAGGITKVSFYRNTDPSGKKRFFNDLCKGPHVGSTKEIGPFALTKIAGAYWRGDETRPMLQRIYGVAFATQAELDQYLERLRQAELRDHRKLGKELELFVFSDLVGPGLPLYTPKGALLRRLIMDYVDELQQRIGYQTVHTPNINKAELFKLSGHYEKFKGDMFSVHSHYTHEEYFLKPMNCPMHTQLYAARLRSYKDLPVRFADFANLYRDEKPGELSGLTRLRCFSQDDAHCFCREDQIEAEFVAVLGIIREALTTYHMEYSIRLSLRDEARPENYIGTDATWRTAQATLEDILKRQGITYTRAEGEAAFYGPKMDIMVRDTIGRQWQISTIQLDFGMPTRFGLTYVDADGKQKTPVMIHRAIIGSPERFMGILIEHYAGAFPLWLAPEQVVVATVGEAFNSAAEQFAAALRKRGIRVSVDVSPETVNRKVRNAELQKTPYVLVFGEKEAGGDQLMVRVRGQKEVQTLSRAAFTGHVTKLVSERRAEL